MKRRYFIQSLLVSTAGGLCLPLSSFRNRADHEKYGIILSSLKKEVRDNPEEVFKRLSEAGYIYIESIGRYGIPAEHTMPHIKEFGLIPITTGDVMSLLLKDIWRYLELANQYDLPYIVCYDPWVGDAETITPEHCLEAANNLNRIAKIVHENGRKFAWHNHHKEFHSLEDGTLPFDIIMDNTDKEMVNLELDIFWVKYAGKEPLFIMEQYAERIKILHLKDMQEGNEQKNTAPGLGIIDFSTILKMKTHTATEYCIIEFNGDDLGLDDAVNSIRYLRGLNQ